MDKTLNVQGNTVSKKTQFLQILISKNYTFT